MAPERSGTGSGTSQERPALETADKSGSPSTATAATTAGATLSASNNESDEQSVLRTATRISLAGSPGGSAGTSWPSSEEVVQAAVSFNTLLKLWSRPGPSRMLIKATEAALRRVDESEVDWLAYLQFSVSAVRTALKCCIPSLGLADDLSVVLPGVLKCATRILARGYGTAAAAATRPQATAGGGGQGRVRELPEQLRISERHIILCGTLDFLIDLSCCLFGVAVLVETDSGADEGTSNQEAATGTTSSAASSAISELRDKATRFFHGAVKELSESNLFEHLAKEMYEMAAEHGRYVLFHSLLFISSTIFKPHVYRATLHKLGLPGPCMLHLLTAAAVEVLRPVDGGPSYGLPAEASQTIQKLLSEVDLSGDLNAGVLNVLQCWVLALTPGAGFNTQSYISAAATYELCLRVVAAVTRAEEARCGASGASAQRQLPAKRGSIALSASIAAHDALAYMRTKGLRRDAAASAEGSGALVRPEEWWRAAVQSLRFTADNVGSEGADATVAWKGVQLLIRRLSKGQMALPLPEAMPPSPPPDVAAALSAGYLPCLLQLARLAHKDKGIIAKCVLSALPALPQLGWLLHYSDKRQASELLTAMQDLVPSLVDSKLVGRYSGTVREVVHWYRARKGANGGSGTEVGGSIGTELGGGGGTELGSGGGTELGGGSGTEPGGGSGTECKGSDGTEMGDGNSNRPGAAVVAVVG
ncbi:hypothetical protein Agub_g12896 [Astrephomene gubernaculifera]|uniref:Uncharacterized protein n=1 Tax=Astrephomene gubernaculifera TaxID=47775 RepID=A0AAD3HRX8_9CHLO|nr:hypothetical protein Agub_g12896 [Astrephomene gubernaculifera]